MNAEANSFTADILIVDDKLENIRFLSEFLSGQQFQVRKAINGQAALTAAEALPPDLILLDINMPGMGGYEVCKHLKSHEKTSLIPVIFLSAGNETVDKVRAFQVGGVDYITKPFQLEEVLVRVQTQLTLQNLQKELRTRNEQLQQAISTLQNTQAELIQQEKLINASRISAGISHEINNPLSFILGNLEPASKYSHQLVTLIQLYQQAFPDPPPEISEFLEEVELDFLAPDFTRVIRSIRTGSERIRAVVNALQTFSRLDESGAKPIHLYESIESVLIMLHYQFVLKQGTKQIVVDQTYGDLPLFLGHASLINQVLLNLLQNAIDALELKVETAIDPTFQPMIWINASIVSPERIQISIQDNGVGVSEENKPRLFEPFFTTKPVGQGMGLSLFTSHQIITELHKGSLTYHANPAGGAAFVIELPVDRQQSG